MNITFEEACRNYLNYVKLKDKQTSYRNISNRVNNYILPYFSDKTIDQLKTIDYLNWQMNIEELNFKYRYKKTLHYCFVTFLNYCINFYDLKENVAVKVGNFKNEETEDSGSVWTLEEFNKFIKVVDDPIYNTLFELLFYTGVRMGEALALTFNDFDSENGIIFINKTITRFFKNGDRVITTPKTKKSIRRISIDNCMKNKILELRDYYNKNYSNFNHEFRIFGGDRVIAPTTLARKKNKYCELADVKIIKIHEFRHSHACLLFQNGVPIDEISYRLGHSTISMTMDVYLRFIPKNEKRVLETLNSIRLLS